MIQNAYRQKQSPNKQDGKRMLSLKNYYT